MDDNLIYNMLESVWRDGDAHALGVRRQHLSGRDSRNVANAARWSGIPGHIIDDMMSEVS